MGFFSQMFKAMGKEKSTNKYMTGAMLLFHVLKASSMCICHFRWVQRMSGFRERNLSQYLLQKVLQLEILFAT